MLKTDPDSEFLRTLSVLYVEDEDEVRELLTRFLVRRFDKVDVAANGREGLELFRAGHHDIVITDVRMPVMDGLAMAAEIKSMEKETPVIVITAYNEHEYFMRAIEIGIDRYITKPIDPGQLLSAIQRSTRIHLQQREIAEAREATANALTQVVAVLARAIECRDPYTDGHQKRVSALAEAVAEAMGLPPEQVVGIRVGAAIHDIGKIRVPTEFLSMPRRLSDEEFTLIKSHVEAGIEILGDVSFPWPIGEMILQHHERLDGSGYPRGLKGDEICLGARIIAVADVVEAMSSDRPYRPAIGPQAAMDEIRTHRGSRYDAAVVDACLQLLEQDPLRYLAH
ncbi:MAG: putative domain HDIG-containing protein [Rhodocyclaceae bacterium]|nr:putative domain HDIG-containing protein [Rhodocyclaceae bacterium]